MNYWLHRISQCPDVSYPLLENGYLSIGWGYFNNPREIIKDEKYFHEEFKSYIPQPRNRWSLHRFLYKMKKGDYVIIPHPYTFSVYEIVEDNVLSPENIKISNLNGIIKVENNKLYKNDREIGLGFFRKVKPVVEGRISRDKYADSALTSRMKIRQTNAEITGLKESIEKAITGYKEQKPINLHSLILDNHLKNTLEIIKHNLGADKFEKLIKWYFERAGANEVINNSKNESDKKGDADVTATFEAIKTMIYVQAKRHDGTTSDWALEQINAYVEYKKDCGKDDEYSKISWVISTGEFSKDCEEKALQADVQLIDGEMFARMLLEVGIGDLDSAF